MKRTLNYLSLALSLTALLVFESCGNDTDGIVIDTDLKIEFDATSASVAENGSAITATITFPTAPTALSLTANITGTAVYDTDYTTTPAVNSKTISISISKGDVSAAFTLTPIDNGDVDGDKTVIFELSASKGIELGTNSKYTVTISDDDTVYPGISSLDENFDALGLADNDDFAASGWLNFAEVGTYTYSANVFSTDTEVVMSSYQSGEDSNISWLIAPKLNFDGMTTKEMSFWNYTAYNDGVTTFQLLYSNDFDGTTATITSATWKELSFIKATSENDNYEFVESGDIDLSSISGSGYIAFKYTGSGDSGEDDSYAIDRLLIGIETPELTITESLTDFGSFDNGHSSTEQSFTVSGVSIKGSVTVSAPGNYEVSTTSGSGFASSVTLADVSSAQTVFVRFSPTSGFNQEIEGQIAFEADNIITKELTITGTETGNVSVGTTERFNGSDAVLSSQYSDGTFTGVANISWSFVESRDNGGYPIDGEGIMLRRSSDNSNISASIDGGIGNFSVKLRKAYTGASDRQVEVFVNGRSVGASEIFGASTGADDTVIDLAIADINVAGTFTLEIKNIALGQVIVDNINWTAFVED